MNLKSRNINHTRLINKPILILAIGLIVSSWSFGQDVQFTASAPSAVENGKQFQVVYTVNTEGSDLKIPELDDFEFLGGPQTSQSSSFQMINGKTSRSVKISYTFYFQAVKEGSFTIPPASIKVKKNIYRSNSLSIEVVKGTTQVQQQQQKKQQTNTVANANDLFIRIYTNKKTAYVGEQIVATVKLYSKYQIEDNKGLKLPTYQGFYKQDIETESRLTQEAVNGETYLTAPLQRVILYPQQSGKLTINPASISLTLLQRVRSNSFFPDYRRFQKELESNEVTINVKPLPSTKPSSYKGAVGTFTFNGSVNKTEVKANEALTFIITLKGKGNIKLIETPQLKLPPDFELFEPKQRVNISNSIAGQSGTKTFEYLAIPRYPGEYTIDPVIFSYFDIQSKTYKTLKTPTFRIKVLKGDDTIQNPIVVGVSKEEVQYLGKDIRFIKTKTNLKNVKSNFVGSTLFYLIYIVLLFTMVLIVVLRRNHVQKNKDVWRVKNKKANKMANKRLRLAQGHLKNGKDESFYEEMAKALWGYIADKLSLSNAELTKDKSIEMLSALSVPHETIDAIMGIIEECEFARYAPPSGTSAMKDSYTKAVKLISEIEQKVR